MVLTQLQLKWPNHSNHLLTRLTHLFKNEQLVDCTLMCNKHSLKVHRSVLAACSPYFERELQNKPSIVIKDMQFNVLQALIEFMYYGETRITEENLTSLIEAAKLFEVKGLSEMDLMTSNQSHIISSVVPDSSVETPNEIDNVEQAFDQSQTNNRPPIQLHTFEEPNDMIIDTTYQPHSSRNFVITPPQTESAQILLSLARSHSQKQFVPADTGFLTAEKCVEPTVNNNMLFTEPGLLLNELPTSTPITEKTKSDIDINSKSLLAKLLTRNNQTACPKTRYDDNYKVLLENEAADDNEDDDDNDNDNGDGDGDDDKSKELQPGIILECPFLIETNDGNYVDVSIDNMLNVFENGEIFDTNGKTVKIIPKEEVCQEKTDIGIENAVLEHIKHETIENEFKDDPEAVVLCKVNEDGQVEKYVLSSSDIQTLKEMNERAKKRHEVKIDAPHIAEIEIPVSNSSTPLITHIMDCGMKIENAISKLPFRRAGYLNVPLENEKQRILDSTLTVDAHHHENMFEELDNQFSSLDCTIENIEREYVAYEEASKNETQLEHNYYANAMKDEDEECVVINDDYDLRMMIEETGTDNAAGKAKIKPNSFQIIGAQDVYLNGYGTKTPRSNGTMIVNGKGKCDLILNNDALMSSVLTPKSKKPVNGTTKFRTYKSADTPASSPLPFKSVKSATAFRSSQEKKPKRTYKRKNQTGRNRNGSSTTNSLFANENNLVEEIIVDEIS